MMPAIKNIAAQLSAAAISLVSLHGHAADQVNAHKNPDQDKWQFQGSVLGYSEPDRVSVLEAIAAAQYQIDTDQSLLVAKSLLMP